MKLMKQNRYMAFVLSFLLIVTFTACGQKDKKTEESAVLPFGLQFGQSYDEFSKVIEAEGFETSLSPADSNNGYVTESIRLSRPDAESHLDYEVFHTPSDNDMFDDYLESETFYYSFNQDKELYEWYWFRSTITHDAEEIIHDMTETYNKFFGFDGKTDDPSSPAVWKTEKLVATLRTTITAETSVVILSVHSFAYDLDGK